MTVTSTITTTTNPVDQEHDDGLSPSHHRDINTTLRPTTTTTSTPGSKLNEDLTGWALPQLHTPQGYDDGTSSGHRIEVSR